MMREKAALVTVFILLVLATLVWQIDTAKGQIVTDGLVSYWTFDEGELDGDVAMDVWGENDGTIHGGAETVEGKFGQALHFDGVDDTVEVPNSDSLALSDKMTIEAWVNIDEFVVNAAIVAKGTGIFLALELANVGEFKIRTKLGGNAQGMYPGHSVGVWYHAVMVIDGRGDEAFRLYIDGELKEPALNNAGVGDLVSPESLYIGLEQRNGMWYKGVIDEVRIYNKALSHDEIMQNFEAQGLAISSPDEKLNSTWGKIKTSR